MHSLAPRPSSTARLRLSLQSLWLLGLFTLLLLALSGPARAQRGGEYQVTRATYGTSWQGMDVTQRVHQLAQQGGSFQVSNDLFGADPAPNQRKVLRIEAQGWDGRGRTFEVAESQWLDTTPFAPQGGGGWYPGQGQPPGQGHGQGHWNHNSQVVQATYGTPWQGMDVTDRVRQLVRQGSGFSVSNDLFGADPAPNQRKVLRVQIRGRDGRTQTAEFAESSWVSPSQLVDGYGGNGGYNPGGPGYGYLTIHRATYGDGYRQVDVTQRLRAYIYNGRLNVEASNDLAGTDPAPNRRKQLYVEYSVGNNGLIQRVTVGESDRLRLP